MDKYKNLLMALENICLLKLRNMEETGKLLFITKEKPVQIMSCYSLMC